VPLYSETPSSVEYISLQAAMESRTMRVQEVSDSGSVGDLLVINTGGIAVLALDGEELAGAKQNRILNTTVLLAPESRSVIRVSCTEQGSWHYAASREFKSSDSFAPPRIREHAKRAVSQSLASELGFRADQGAVWDYVDCLAAEARVHSTTKAMSDVVKARLPNLDRIASRFTAQPGQCGLLAFADGEVLGFDAISRSDVYSCLHTRLLRSYLLDIQSEGDSLRAADYESLAIGFIQSCAASEEHSFKSPGLGDDFRYTGGRVVGSALLAAGEVVHSAFFRTSGRGRPGGATTMRGLQTRRAFRGDPFTIE
jgi:hypothetical protein